MRAETQKILDKSIKISATCVRVPVFIGHAESINIELDSPLSEKQATEVLSILKIFPLLITGRMKVMLPQLRQPGKIRCM